MIDYSSLDQPFLRHLFFIPVKIMRHALKMLLTFRYGLLTAFPSHVVSTRAGTNGHGFFFSTEMVKWRAIMTRSLPFIIKVK